MAEKKELWEIAVQGMRDTAKRGGRPRKFDSPTKLIDAFAAYCEWAKNNPMVSSDRTAKKMRAELADGKVKQTPSAAETTQATIARPLSIDGFCAHAGIGNWTQMKADYDSRPGFRSIFAGIERAIREQQTAGGMIGIYDSSLTARIAGLSEKKEVNVNGEVSTRVTYKSFMPHNENDE